MQHGDAEAHPGKLESIKKRVDHPIEQAVEGITQWNIRETRQRNIERIHK
jgi:hypothetical protein